MKTGNAALHRRFVVGAFIYFLLSLTAVADITGISIPRNSQLQSRPFFDDVWSVSASSGALDTSSGIGIIVNTVWIQVNDANDFALHQNQENGSPAYMSDHVPDSAASTVTFTFDRPTIVRGVEIVQHVNGVTRVAGVLDSTSLGPVFGPSGDITTGFVVPSDGVSQVFDFANTGIAGTVFRLTISKTSHFHSFALHRAFPLDADGRRIAPSSGLGGVGRDPARVRKQKIRDDLAALMPTNSGRDDRRVEKAIEHIDKSLRGDRWSDDALLVAKDGKKVFSEEAKAADELLEVRGTDVLRFVLLLVDIDHQLASAAISETRKIYTGAECESASTGACKKAARELLAAEKEIADAAAAFANADYVKAIDEYGKAWYRSDKALKMLSE